MPSGVLPQPHAPAADLALAGLEPNDALPAGQRVGRAGHRLGGQAMAPSLGSERVAGVELDHRVGGVAPQLHRPAVRALERDPGPAVIVALEVGERIIDLELADPPRGAE